MVQGEIIAIGDELISGRVTNTTSFYLARRLFDLGYPVVRILTIGDSPQEIKEALKKALSRASFVIVSGGLGPTTDDITNEAVAEALSRRLHFFPEIMSRVEARLEELGRQVLPSHKKLALLPEGAEVLDREGWAAGYLLVEGEKPVFFLPGVPRQLEDLFEREVIPRLRRFIPQRVSIRQRVLKVFGLQETEVNLRLEEIARGLQGLKVGYYPVFPEVHITLTSLARDEVSAGDLLEEATIKVREALGPFVFGEGQETLESVVGRLLRHRSARVAVAESCTGGLIASRFTRVPGSSAWFDRGVVTYSNEAKVEILKVPKEIIDSRGAVSRETAAAMARGMLAISGVDYALSVTGIAGPSGGSPQKPVGTVFIALAQRERVKVQRFQFSGTRHMIQLITSETALDWLRRHLAYGEDIPGYPSAHLG
ncbi:competence/damage-inducible protein A [Thermosulfuriphilus sp.]